jgi:hypothetical protein
MRVYKELPNLACSNVEFQSIYWRKKQDLGFAYDIGRATRQFITLPIVSLSLIFFNLSKTLFSAIIFQTSNLIIFKEN